MGFFSKSCEHGIRAVVYLSKYATEDHKRILREISEATDSPEAFTAKILQELTKNQLISSVKGPSGGFFLTRKQLQEVNLRQVVEAIDGPELFTQCTLGLKACSVDKPCALHDGFAEIRGKLAVMLCSTKLYMLQESGDIPDSVLKFS